MSRVLVDTSVWVAHFRQSDHQLIELLHTDRVLMHPLILGEIACGTPPERTRTLRDLAHLQQIPRAGIRETLEFVERQRLYGLGCGLIDLQLLACTLISPDTTLWTRDRRLQVLAERFGVTPSPTSR